jgi:type IV secretion system protein VirB9
VIRPALALLLGLSPLTVLAQTSPVPGMDDPRLQTVTYDPSRPVRLVAFPGSTLTLMLLPGDRIERAVLSQQGAFEVRVTGAGDSLNIASLRPDAAATLVVDTRERRYEFDLATGQGLAAAYLVRFVDPGLGPGAPDPVSPPPPLEIVGEYRLRGDRALRPVAIGDDGLRTWIEWGEYQALPAVFGIGPTGEEEVVDGYMRGGRFVIDRVYAELVFRIDRERASARRIGGLGTG